MNQELADMTDVSLTVSTEDFDQQAAVWEKTWPLYVQLWDSLQIIHKNQTQARGFLYAGKIYTLQGDNMRAVRILEKGMSVIPPTDPQLKLFEQLYSEAKRRAESYIDFITESPHEILCEIVRHLDTFELSQCIDVCGTWRSMLFGCSVAWRDINTKTSDFWRREVGFALLPTVSHYIETIDIRDRPKVMRKLIVELLSQHSFPRLSSLSFLPTALGQIDISSPVYLTLDRAAETLTELRFSWGLDISLGRILSTCKSLTILELKVKYIEDCDISHDTILTRVDIEVFLAPSIAATLAPLFQHSPNLRHFYFHPRRHTADNILTSIGDHCPNLTRISTCNDILDDIYQHVPELSSRNDEDSLVLLVINSVRSIQPISSLLAKGRKTLRAMYLRPFDYALALHGWKPLSESAMPKLTYLSVTILDGTASQVHYGAILRCCPALETLLLDNETEFYGDFGDNQRIEMVEIFNAIANLTKLSFLQMYTLDIRGQAFIQMLQSRHGENTALQSLTIRGCYGITAAVLYNIAKIMSLKRLTVSFDDYYVDIIKDEETVEFTRLIALLQHLQYLELSEVPFPYEAAEVLVLSSSLRTVHLYDLQQSLSEDAQSLLIDRFSRGVSFDWA
ncbi:hypothetical protein BJV82DRAFT_590233 [Fennellomyces sp. T-0311]|nr:hypothetical protein BJV82DRAFT_590233 [Fennellomyces sp. T-0311]